MEVFTQNAKNEKKEMKMRRLQQQQAAYPVKEHGHRDDASRLGELHAFEDLLSVGHNRTR